MQNALREPQNIVVFGGTSEIGLAIVRRLLTPRTRHVVLACRDPEAGERCAQDLRSAAQQLTVQVVSYQADDVTAPSALIDGIAAEIGDIDIVVVAVGVLGVPAVLERDPIAAAQLFQTNTVGGVTCCLAVANRFRHQGHGRLVVLSSVAGERVRRSNFVYGASKAGLDAFAQGLGDSLAGTGASVLVVRPGFVRTRMTEGMDSAPFATDPASVADAVAAALTTQRRMIWVPGTLRWVFMVLRHLPGPVWRRLPLK
jgi:decaprenylphospho-beta-D-erythro-pentofuranosid-2-ulose 2-reductase